MLKKIFYLLILLLLIGFALPAMAHTEKSAGSMTALLHINPNDTPVAGQTSTLIFELTDKNGKFDTNNCDCTITIRENEQDILIKKSVEASVTKKDNTLSFDFIFPEEGEYDIDLGGKPLSGSDFQEFGFDFSVSAIEKQSFLNLISDRFSHSTHSILGHFAHIILFGAAIIISLFVIIFDKRDKIDRMK